MGRIRCRDIDIAKARASVQYDPETGVFTRINSHVTKLVGTVAGVPDSYGYIQFSIGGRLCLAHRVAYCLMTGQQIPDEHVIDHINGDKADNRWGNLRCVTRAWNQHNRWVAPVTSGSGVLGIRKVPSGRWVARIVLGDGTGKRITVGTYDTREQAKEAYNMAKAKHQPGSLI